MKIFRFFDRCFFWVCVLVHGLSIFGLWFCYYALIARLPFSIIPWLGFFLWYVVSLAGIIVSGDTEEWMLRRKNLREVTDV